MHLSTSINSTFNLNTLKDQPMPHKQVIQPLSYVFDISFIHSFTYSYTRSPIRTLIHLFVCLFTYLYACLPICMLICLFICSFAYTYARLPIYTYIHLLVHMLAYLYDLCHNSIYTVLTSSPFGYYLAELCHIIPGPFYMIRVALAITCYIFHISGLLHSPLLITFPL